MGEGVQTRVEIRAQYTPATLDVKVLFHYFSDFLEAPGALLKAF